MDEDNDPADFIPCPLCGGDMEWVDCWQCGGEGGFHDCGEDCCCCLEPENDTDCDVCRGEGGYLECVYVGTDRHEQEQAKK